jgi:hypothetical protein
VRPKCSKLVILEHVPGDKERCSMYSSWRMNTKACGNSVHSTRIRRLPEIVLHRVRFSRNVCAERLCNPAGHNRTDTIWRVCSLQRLPCCLWSGSDVCGAVEAPRCTTITVVVDALSGGPFRSLRSRGTVRCSSFLRLVRVLQCLLQLAVFLDGVFLGIDLDRLVRLRSLFVNCW